MVPRIFLTTILCLLSLIPSVRSHAENSSLLSTAEVDAYGIRPGMTIAEANKAAARYGGTITEPDPKMLALVAKQLKSTVTAPNTNFFRYILKGPGGASGFPNYSLTLYTYPTAGVLNTDPSTRVIYAMMGVKSSEGAGPIGGGSAASSLKLEPVAKQLTAKYGPIREVSSQGGKAEMALLPTTQRTKSYPISAVQHAPNNPQAQLKRGESCIGLQFHVIQTFNSGYGIHFSKYLGGQNAQGKITSEMGAATYNLWKNCGDVVLTGFPRLLQDGRTKQVEMFFYDLNSLEKAMNTFSQKP